MIGNFNESLRGVLAWGIFFASSVFGHLALKRAAALGGSYDFSRSFGVFVTPWGAGAIVAWGVSAWAWALVLTRHRLIDANAIAAIRVVLCAVVAVIWMGERGGLREVAGTLLVVAGVWLLRG